MPDLTFHVPSKVYLSLNAIDRLGIIAAEYGTRALLVADDILTELDHTKRIRSLLETKGLKCIVFDEIPSDVTSRAVVRAAELAKVSQSQMIIGLGGVHALSVAKCTAKMAVHDTDFDSFLSGEPFDEHTLPYIELPTTCRNPMMFTDRALIVDARDRSAKKLILNSFPNEVLIDPSFATTLSAKYTVTTMFDTFLSSLEGYLSKKSNFLTDMLFLESFSPLISNIRRLSEEPGNINLRRFTAQAGVLSALGLSMSYPGIGTALSNVISAKFHIPQAGIATVLLPHIIDYGVNINPEKIAAVGETIGETTRSGQLESAKYLVEYIRHLIASLRLPLRLSDYELKFEELASVIDTARTFEGLAYLPEPITSDDIYMLLKQAF